MYYTEKHRTVIHISFIVLAAALLLTALPLFALRPAEAASVTASGKTTDVVNVRKKASVSSKSLGTLKKNTKVKITKEVFTSSTSSSSSKRWYYVKAGGKKGYVRADLIKNIKFKGKKAHTTDALNYRTGPATSFKVRGTLEDGESVKLLLPAKRAGSSEKWYRIKAGGKKAYVIGSYVSSSSSSASAKAEEAAPAPDLSGKSELAQKLLSNPTNGGKARYVYTFDSSNCTKKFSVTGSGNVWVPQGMAFTGSQYYILFGMSWGQKIITYSADGVRQAESNFAFDIGHPNGITWNPPTGLCYIFKGNQKTIYTWDPATGKYGRAKTPYSSSGVGYDSSANLIYASSQTGIRVYSSDGSFTHKKLFSRCNHGIKHYIQDCGSGGGFVFHGISGSDKHKTNFLDVYRVSDGKYLGSIKVALGETESVIVNNEGYVELLINHADTYTEYIWQTPLNVNELK